MPRETKQLLYNLLNQSSYETKLQENKPIQISLSVTDSNQLTSSAQARVINHHLMKLVSTEVTKSITHKKLVDRVKSADTIVLSRFLGYPEINSTQYHEIEQPQVVDP